MTNLQTLRDLMAEKDVSSLLVTDNTNIRWLTGFTGSFGVALVTHNDAVFVTDSRYTIQAGNEISDLPVVSFSRPQTVEKIIAEYANQMGVTQIAFETSATYAAVEKTQK
ncbi:aminopeptidase P family N-terminal domain-containing protein [Kamptonema cortianum]|nr:aminopeptidase P family N-terminal domain-containing protein [Kamptonema cortianum]